MLNLALPLGTRVPEAVLLGFSGGLDSTVLLHAISTSFGAGLSAIHVHHGLHPDADVWAAHCRRVCEGLEVPLKIVRVEVVRNRGDGLEAAARNARHAAFQAELHDDEILALAHHRDDQAETFLLRALRASGPDGLGAMRRWRRFGRGWLWRPLLDLPRSELLAYAQQHGLQWIEDPSNTDTAIDRNFLRHRVLPLLRERWPQADAAFARSSALSAQAVDLLDAEDAQALAALRGGDLHVLAVAALLQLSAARRARVLRRWITELALPPLPAAGIDRIENDLLPAAADRVAEFTWQGAVIRRWRGSLHAERKQPALPPQWKMAWDGHDPAQLPAGGTLRLEGAAGFDAPLLLGARQGGERVTLPGRSHSHSLKHVLQDIGVPPWVRERLPVLLDARGKVMAAGDLAYSAEFDGWLRDRGARLVWSREKGSESSCAFEILA